jgi:hypothetical protein
MNEKSPLRLYFLSDITSPGLTFAIEYPTVDHMPFRATAQNIAKAFGGDPTKHGRFSGLDVSMKLYLPIFLQYLDNLLRSHISPIDIPNKLRK